MWCCASTCSEAPTTGPRQRASTRRCRTWPSRRASALRAPSGNSPRTALGEAFVRQRLLTRWRLWTFLGGGHITLAGASPNGSCGRGERAGRAEGRQPRTWPPPRALDGATTEPTETHPLPVRPTLVDRRVRIRRSSPPRSWRTRPRRTRRAGPVRRRRGRWRAVRASAPTAPTRRRSRPVPGRNADP